MMTHRIRLLGPWQLATQASAGQASVEHAPENPSIDSEDKASLATIKLPGSIDAAVGPAFHGLVRLSRRFHRPTGLCDGDRVWLTLEASFAPSRVELNGKDLAKSAAPAALEWAKSGVCFEITHALLTSNLLVFELRYEPAIAPAEIHSVALEIDGMAS